MQQINASQLAEWLKTDTDKIYLLDVREPREWEICHIEGASLQPMQSVPAALSAIQDAQGDKALVCICHHGGRSMQVAQFLEARGLTNIYNLAGGVDGWAREVDNTMQRY